MLRRRFLIWLAMLAIVVLLSVFTPFGVYKTYESHFSPDEFAFRATQHYELCGIQITPRSVGEKWTPPLIDHLRATGYIPDSGREKVRWHFIRGRKPGLRGWRGPAAITRGLFSEHWVDWSDKHPEHADYLWPRIVQHTRAARYRVVFGILNSLYEFDGTIDELMTAVSTTESVLAD